MSLNVGDRLGHYDVTAQIGAGGMGEVDRARDTTLDRDVALKVLPEAFTADPDRLARFEREARVLASLNHPNIAAIHGIEEDEADGTRALVLELVEGPTLADRIAHGPMPIEDALPIARQIAEALEAAHEAGIVHRDLKPANIKVREDGTVKVLDFGLAKALQPESPAPDASVSPTISLTAAATQLGMVIGTAAYMAPEQAKGKPVDKRADVWAFGAVLYEMLTGRRAFAGGDVSETLAHVITKDVDWDALPTGTPAAVRHVLRRCLARDPKRRLRDIGDAWLDLDDGAASLAKGDSPVEILARNNFSQLTFSAQGNCCPVWSPTGEQVVFTSNRDGVPRLYRKNADGTGDVERLTTSARTSFAADWSPDGGTVLFVEGGDIHTLELEGDYPPAPLLETPFFELNPAVSPDRQWLAYQSSEDGDFDVYVRPFPDVDSGQWKVSASGGRWPVWSHDGSELFFLTGETVMAAAVTAGSTFSWDPPVALFRRPPAPAAGEAFTPAFDVASDGRFLMRTSSVAAGADAGAAPELIAVFNWSVELAELVPLD